MITGREEQISNNKRNFKRRNAIAFDQRFGEHSAQGFSLNEGLSEHPLLILTPECLTYTETIRSQPSQAAPPLVFH